MCVLRFGPPRTRGKGRARARDLHPLRHYTRAAATCLPFCYIVLPICKHMAYYYRDIPDSALNTI